MFRCLRRLERRMVGPVWRSPRCRSPCLRFFPVVVVYAERAVWILVFYRYASRFRGRCHLFLQGESVVKNESIIPLTAPVRRVCFKSDPRTIQAKPYPHSAWEHCDCFMSDACNAQDTEHALVNRDSRKLVRKAERDPWNRLMSILVDAEWVHQFLSRRLKSSYPVIPNLRCGAWYTPSGREGYRNAQGVYFKSTDGHTWQWSFSFKRLNLHLIPLIEDRGGCVIVDSTRRGKSMPDALSKTIPIWCAVLNGAMFSNEQHISSSKLRLPEHIVSPSEASQIEAQLRDWIGSLTSSDINLPRLSKPLRPIFISRSHFDAELALITSNSVLAFHPVILLSVSQIVPTPSLELRSFQDVFCEQGQGADLSFDTVSSSVLGTSSVLKTLRDEARFVYVQGSGDDEEAWAMGLKPQAFWLLNNLQLLLSTRGDVEGVQKCIREIVLQERMSSMTIAGPHSISPNGLSDIRIGNFPIFLGFRPWDYEPNKSDSAKYKVIIHVNCSQAPPETTTLTITEKHPDSSHFLHFNIPSGKRGLTPFRQCIPAVLVSMHGELESLFQLTCLFLVEESVVSSSTAGTSLQPARRHR